jgi:DNA mismatch repair protein PMS2
LTHRTAITDQHASDEKYNFETLQQTTKIKAQTLFQCVVTGWQPDTSRPTYLIYSHLRLRPRKLELTSADELTAVDNIAVLEANGFQLSVQEDAAYGRGERLKLLAMPVSKETVFDFKDLEEIIYLLQDRPPGTMVRCKKARAMFAMRACRKSVMFGKPLATAQMLQVSSAKHTSSQISVTDEQGCIPGRSTSW